MDIRLCEPASGATCYEPAVGTGIRPVRWCRPHYLEAIADDIVRATVVGSVPVTDVRTGRSVGLGGVVELDPVETRIAQLVYAGHIKVMLADGGALPPRGTATVGDGDTETVAKTAKRG